jgi:hypothetical protein
MPGSGSDPTSAYVDAMLMMLPDPARTICAPNTWHGRKTPVTFTSSMRRHASSG